MKLLDSIFATVAPHLCIVCEREGSLLCRECSQSVASTLPPRCFRCNALSDNSATCRTCRRVSVLKHVWVTSEYEGVPKTLVHTLKFAQARSASVNIAQLMTKGLPDLPSTTIVTHVPTATSRSRQRGFDQASLIAKELAYTTGFVYKPLLLRQGQSRQVGASRGTRASQLTDAFRPRHGKIDPKAYILLVDDVITTGATLEAAARTLKANGAHAVGAAVFCQKRLS